MKNDITAVVLTKESYERKFEGIEVFPYISTIRTPAELLFSRFSAIHSVKTPYFFYLDDDDDLPDDYLSVLDECKAADVDMAYTDELFVYPNGTSKVRKSDVYSHELHLRNALLVHHLVLCKTSAAKSAIARAPRGMYCPEYVFYWELGRGSTAYIPRVGYLWNKKPTGMHRRPETTISQVQALRWCRAHP